MTDDKATFRPIGDSDQHMHGRPAILASGFTPTEQRQLRSQMDEAGLSCVPIVYITADSLSLTPAELAGLPGETNAGLTAELPRVIVLSGLTERQLHLVMDSYRAGDLPRPIWASVTPVSADWTLKSLLVELLKERDAMRQSVAGAASSSPPEGQAETSHPSS